MDFGASVLIMSTETYSLRRIYKKDTKGITNPKFCTINAILKSDGIESPQCVYNELVATNIAQTLHVPNAMGVLTKKDTDHIFASLEIAKPSTPLPNIRKGWFKDAAKLYPDQAAALVVFDIFIGNSDRYQNLKVSLFNENNPIFCAFDHSHSLLHPYYSTDKAIKLLHSDELLAKQHPFYGLIECHRLNDWCLRFMEASDYLIRECCEVGHTLNTVDITTQRKLANALVWRKDNLQHIIKKHGIKCVE